ncbi:MAG: mechanosensitive ion channel domain-containing protein [Sandaracinaceae bacterium]
MRRWRWVYPMVGLAALPVVFGPGEATAQQGAGELPDGISATDETIETDAERRTADEAIRERLRGIFGATEALNGIGVEVREGVVTLRGEVLDPDASALAERLASRTRGVVAVNNRLERDRSVEGQITPATERARSMAESAVANLPVVGVAVAVVLFFWVLGWLLARQGWLWRRVSRNPLVASLLQRSAVLVFVVLGLVLALNILDAIAVLSAVLGAAGVRGIAVGFAVRDSIENFIASVMLSLRQPFRPKDLVDIDGREGNVVRLTSRATILLTLDGNHLRIPNADVFKAGIVNYTRHPERRFTFELGIDAADDPNEALSKGVESMAGLAFVLDDPPPNAWIERVGDSNVVLTFAPWIDQRDTDFLKARSVAIATVKAALEEGGFTLPEPIYRLRIDEAPAELGVVPSPPRAAGRAEGARKDPEAPPDTSRDRSVEAQIDADRSANPDNDLLSDAAPTEFGDGPGG